MKSTIKLFGIIALAAVMVFTACGGGDSDGGSIINGGNGDGDPDLTPKITMTTTVSGSTCIYLLGTGKAVIDWGDGTVEEVTLTSSDDVNDLWNYDFNHSYASSAVKTITVTGNVTGFSGDGDGAASALNVSGFPGLKFLSCQDEALTSLDLSKNTALEFLNCNGNELTSLDLSKNTALEFLYCAENELTSLDLSKNTALKILNCSWNDLTTLNITGCTKLENVGCNKNQLAAAALVAILDALPDRTGLSQGLTYVYDNIGVNGTGYAAAKTAAVAKNWDVNDI